MKMRKIITKDDCRANPKRSKKELKPRPELSASMVIPRGVFGDDLKGGKS